MGVLGSGWDHFGAAARMSQSVFVTGGAGYIGSHACKILAQAGYQPIVFDNLSRGHREAVRWGPLVEGDLADRERLVTALQAHRASAVTGSQVWHRHLRRTSTVPSVDPPSTTRCSSGA